MNRKVENLKRANCDMGFKIEPISQITRELWLKNVRTGKLSKAEALRSVAGSSFTNYQKGMLREAIQKVKVEALEVIE